MNISGSSHTGLFSPRSIARFASAPLRHRRGFCAAFSVIALAASVRAGVVYSWEGGFDGWSAGTNYSITTTSALGVTDGTSALQLTAPASDMWWSFGLSRGLSGAELQSLFSNATHVTVDVTYNPGNDTWYTDGFIALIVQGENQSWTELPGGVTIPKGTTPTTATLSFSPTVAANMASSTWGSIGFRIAYGNGNNQPGVYYFDNFTTDAVSIPEPSSCALTLGLVAIGASALRRRRRV